MTTRSKICNALKQAKYSVLALYQFLIFHPFLGFIFWYITVYNNSVWWKCKLRCVLVHSRHVFDVWFWNLSLFHSVRFLDLRGCERHKIIVKHSPGMAHPGFLVEGHTCKMQPSKQKHRPNAHFNQCCKRIFTEKNCCHMLHLLVDPYIVTVEMIWLHECHAYTVNLISVYF